MTIRVQDNFTDTDGTELKDHTPDVDVVGGGWSTPVGSSALFTIESNELEVHTEPDTPRATSVIDAGISDFKLTCTIRVGSGGSDLTVFVRYADDDNYINILYQRIAPSFIKINKNVGGSITQVANVPAPTGAGTFDLEVTVNGEEVTAKDVTNNVVAVAEISELQSNTKAGFRDNDSGISYFVDDLLIETVEPLPEEEACDVQIELVQFSPPTEPFPAEAATIEVTHPNLEGIVPKGIILHWVRGNPETDGDACWGVGACDEIISQWAVSWAAGEGNALSSSDYVREARILELPPCDGDITGQFNDGNARIDKFIDGGFEMTWFDGSPGDIYDVEGVILNAIIFAGGDVMTLADKHDINTDPLSVDDIGFPPDGIFTASPSQDAPDPDLSADWQGGWGWADLQTVNNVAHLRATDNGGTSDYRETVRSAEAQGNIIAGGALDYTVRYSDPGSPANLIGTEANQDNGTSGAEIPYFAFRAAGADVRAGIVLGPGSAGDWVVTDPGFKPQFVMLFETTIQSVDQVIDHDAFFGISAFTDDDEFANWINYENNSASPIARSGHQEKAAFLQDRITPAVLIDGTFKSFDDDGWTLDFETVQQGGAAVDPSGWRYGYLAIGECPEDPAVVTADDDPNCVTDVWTGPAPPVDNGIADVQIEIGRFQVNPTEDSIFEFLQPALDGKTPKAALFLANYTEATSGQETVLDQMLSHGAASKSPGGALRRWVAAGMNEDAVATPDTVRDENRISVIAEPDRSGSTTPSAQGYADILDFIPNGVRLQTIQNFSVAFNVIVVFFAGDDLEAYAWRWDTQDHPDGSLVGGLGFQPDMLITAKSATEFGTTYASSVSSLVGFGGINLRDDEIELGTFNQVMPNGGAVQFGSAVVNDTKNAVLPSHSPFTRQTRKVLAGNRFGDGFEAVLSNSDATGFLALKLPSTGVWVDVINPPVTTGIWDVSDPGFEPQFVMLEQTMTDLVGDEDSDVVVDARAGPIGIGVFTPDDAHAVAASSELGVTPTNTESSIDDNPVYLNDDAGASAFRAVFNGMRSDGWRLTYDDADSTQRKWLGFAIGLPGPL